MTRRLNFLSGISLVEMLIVLAALLTLAMLLQPRASLAGDQQLKARLDRSLIEIAEAVAIYQMRTAGIAPTLGEHDRHRGWGPLVEIGLLDRPPINPYNASDLLVVGEPADARSHGPSSSVGWVWDPEARVVHAAGYAPERRTLFHERSFADLR